MIALTEVDNLDGNRTQDPAYLSIRPYQTRYFTHLRAATQRTAANGAVPVWWTQTADSPRFSGRQGTVSIGHGHWLRQSVGVTVLGAVGLVPGTLRPLKIN